MNQKTIIAIVAVLIVIGAIYFYGGYNYGMPTNTGSPSATPQGPNQVSIKNFAFAPATLTIKAGDTVTWINNDSAAHDISGSGFKSPIMSNGQGYSFKFTSVGTFDYICGIHPGMKGIIIVK